MYTADLAVMTTGDIARETGVADWAVRRTLDAMGIAQRVGPYRIVAADDLPAIRAELLRRGFLKAGDAGGGEACGPS